MIENLEDAVRRVMELLAAKDYYAPEELTGGVRLSAGEIRQVINEYGKSVLVPPPQAFAHLDAIEIVTTPPGTWSVTMPLWTEEEGRSDLSAEMTISLNEAGPPRVELDNIHVL